MGNMTKLDGVRDVLLGKTYELSLAREYVSRWGLSQAVRELIQNALDSSSPFVYEFAPVPDATTWTLRLNSEFTVLSPEVLLLGATSKGEDSSAIGSFGEGLKLAMLVLIREGFDIDIYNGPRLWKPRFAMSRMFQREVLVVDETFSGKTAAGGLTVIVSGLTSGDCDRVRASCLRMQDNIGAIRTTKYGEILLEQPGKLYVGSLYICDTDLKYGYNVQPQHMPLERDRQTVSDWDLRSLTVKMWYDIGDIPRVARMIADEVPDVEYSQYNAPEIVREECYNIFREAYPQAVIASSPSDARAKITAGLIRTVYAGSSMYSAVSSSSSYKLELPQLMKDDNRVSPHVALASHLSAYEKQMSEAAAAALRALIREAEAKWVLS